MSLLLGRAQKWMQNLVISLACITSMLAPYELLMHGLSPESISGAASPEHSKALESTQNCSLGQGWVHYPLFDTGTNASPPLLQPTTCACLQGRKLGFEFAAALVLGRELDDQTRDELSAHYSTVLTAFFTVVVGPPQRLPNLILCNELPVASI